MSECKICDEAHETIRLAYKRIIDDLAKTIVKLNAEVAELRRQLAERSAP